MFVSGAFLQNQPGHVTSFMLQHMQYTGDKCVYFLNSALRTTATAPPTATPTPISCHHAFQPAVTGKCQCFNPSPLMSAGGRGACSASACWVRWRHVGSLQSSSSSYYAHLRCREGKPEGHASNHSHAPLANSLWCHFIKPPQPRPPQRLLIVQLLLLVD